MIKGAEKVVVGTSGSRYKLELISQFPPLRDFFQFNRCRRSSTAVRPVKFQTYSQNPTDKSNISLTETLANEALVSPPPRLHTDTLTHPHLGPLLLTWLNFNPSMDK